MGIAPGVDEKGPLHTVSSQERGTVKEGGVIGPGRTWFQGAHGVETLSRNANREETLKMSL